MAAPKAIQREHELTDRKPRRIRESGKTVDQRRPLHERMSVQRALMRLPLGNDRKWYAVSIGVPETHLNDLLNRVDGKHLSTTDSHAIAVERIQGESVVKLRRRRKGRA